MRASVHVFQPPPRVKPAYESLAANGIKPWDGDKGFCKRHMQYVVRGTTWGWRCPAKGCGVFPDRPYPFDDGFRDWLRTRVAQLNGCPKCHFRSGDSWAQCRRACPVPGSPHYTQEAITRVYVPEPEKPACGCHCFGGCVDPYAACARPCQEHIPF